MLSVQVYGRLIVTYFVSKMWTTMVYWTIVTEVNCIVSTKILIVLQVVLGGI